jgi:predicted enzyme related to lactoylglutathione lyase
MKKDKIATVVWFEIPVNDMQRAMAFYSELFQVELEAQDFGEVEMAFIPMGDGTKGAGGSLIKAGDHYTPSHKGTLIYFSCEDVDNELSRLEDAGGEILQPKTQISPEYGYMAMFEDTEGNRIALHSEK